MKGSKYYVQFFISVDILHMGTNANHIGDMNCYSAFFNLFLYHNFFFGLA